jgi:BirA family biotin operon repressor/biotin-[acetyl-CoA-carboxylase] ligase
MEVARLEAQKGAEEGTVVVLGRQTAGRGRLKRLWLSPEGSVALSIILRPHSSCLPSLVMLASLAVVYSVKEVSGLESQIKWPNDVLIGNKKVSGILIENAWHQKNVDYAVIGIGVNANFKASDFPEIAATATSLADELGRTVSRLGLIRQLLVELDRLYLAIKGGGSVFEEWRSRLVTLGKKIKVKTGDNTYHGFARSVEADGSLILQLSDGELVRIVAGDATLSD